MTAKKHQPAPITKPATAESIVRPTSAPPPSKFSAEFWRLQYRDQNEKASEYLEQIRELTAENERLKAELGNTEGTLSEYKEALDDLREMLERDE